jgi:hypothetical protein
MAASYLQLPSKSHRGIAKNFVQVNSLHQINVKAGIRTQKDFFMHSSYLFTYREEVWIFEFHQPVFNKVISVGLNRLQQKGYQISLKIGFLMIHSIKRDWFSSFGC